MKRPRSQKHPDADGNYSPTKPSIFIGDDLVSSSITKLSTSTTRRSSALSSCKLTPIKEEQATRARPNGLGDTLHQSLGATESGESLSHVYLVPPRHSPIELDEDQDEDSSRGASQNSDSGPVSQVVTDDGEKWNI